MYLGDFAANATVDFKWNTTAVGTGSITRATNGSIRIYKDESATQRTSANGITDTEDFDSLTGLHHLTIDLSDNTDAGFYAAGSDYQVVVEGMVVDGETFNVVIAQFSIENRHTATALATIDSNVDAILADTNELQTDWADGGRLDLILDARASQTSVDDLPTNSELATALAGADDAVLAAVAGVDGKIDTAQADLDILTGADGATLATLQPNYAPAVAGDIPTAAENATELLDQAAGVETNRTVRQTLRLMAAALLGKASGLNTTTAVYRDTNDGVDRITATVDQFGNRTSVTLDPS